MKVRHTHISRSAALLVVAAGLTVLAGYLAGIPGWTALGTGTAPLNPLAGAAFVLSGVALWLTVSKNPPLRVLRAFGLFLGAASGLAVANLATGWFGALLALDRTGTLQSLAPALTAQAATTDMALAVAFACIGSCTYVLNREPDAIRPWMCLPLIPVFWASYFSITAAFYQVHTLSVYFERTVIPLSAALVFAVFLVGQLAARPDKGVIATVLSRHGGGVLARVTLPVLMLLPFTIGWARMQALRGGRFDLAASFAQFSTTNVVVFGAVLWWCAYLLNRTDARRQTTLESLRNTNQELQRVNTALESKIQEQIRTEEARKRTELQLFQSQKMEAMGTLATGIAHDFNNLLTVILLNAESALETVSGNPALEASLQQIRKSGTHAAEVVRQIMTFGRKNPLGRKPEDVDAMISEAVAMLRHAQPPGIRTQVEVAPGLPRIHADATQVQQVLLNLGNNALQAMQDGGGHLEIKAVAVLCESEPSSRSGLRPGPYVRITVRDDGHGMDGDTIARIFDPFFTTKAPGKGTGLGLSVVHGIMQLHEGAVTVHSTPGRGATFALYFPVAEEEGTAGRAVVRA